jgi:predicted HNH restriction endonuclease
VGRDTLKHRDRRRKLIELHGNKCHDCGLTYEDYVYEFHHRDPSIKEFTLGGKDLNRRWESVMVEASKCDCLCANCHKERHYNESREIRKSN